MRSPKPLWMFDADKSKIPFERLPNGRYFKTLPSCDFKGALLQNRDLFYCIRWFSHILATTWNGLRIISIARHSFTYGINRIEKYPLLNVITGFYCLLIRKKETSYTLPFIKYWPSGSDTGLSRKAIRKSHIEHRRTAARNGTWAILTMFINPAHLPDKNVHLILLIADNREIFQTIDIIMSNESFHMQQLPVQVKMTL